MTKMEMYFSKHAREQMVARGISEKEVEEGIRKGAKSLQPENKILSDYRYYSVVYKKIENTHFVITVNPRW